MTMIFNGTELEEVSFNGVDCEKVYFNGVLVFEKAVGNQYLITVGKYLWDGQYEDYGYISILDDDVQELVKGSFSPEFIEELSQPAGSFVWYLGGYYQGVLEAGIQLVGKSYTFDYSGLWLLTIGSWEGVLVGFDDGGLVWDSYTYPPSGRPFTEADFNLLPKSGTHIVTLRKIA